MSVNTNSRKGQYLLWGFSVYLKGDETPVKIEADRVVPENNGVLLGF